MKWHFFWISHAPPNSERTEEVDFGGSPNNRNHANYCHSSPKGKER